MTLSSTCCLNNHVLVLNRSFCAVRVVSVRRALILLCRQIAEIVNIEDKNWQSYDLTSWRDLSDMHRQFESRSSFDWIKGVSYDLIVPRIVRLLSYDKLPRNIVKFNRRNIFARDNNRCQYCGKKFPHSELSLDHILPRSRGGLANWENIVCSCLKCNVKKANRTPTEAGMKLINKPVKPTKNPAVTLSLSRKKYSSWKHFLNTAYWNIELRDD